METQTVNELTEKETLDDSDVVTIGNNGTGSLRKISWSNIITNLKTKFVNWLFDDLKTSDKTIVGAINEVNTNESNTEDKFDNYLPLTGGTVSSTGSGIVKIKSSGTSGDTGISVTSWSGDVIWLGVGSGGTNRGIYDSTAGAWMIYRDSSNDLYLNTAGGTTYKPYYSAGDSISVTLNTAGFVTSSGTSMRYTIPLSRPIIGSPSRSISATYTIRQGNAYCYGSSSSATVTASSHSTTITPSGLDVAATFDNTTNVTNNSPIGIAATITITLS